MLPDIDTVLRELHDASSLNGVNFRSARRILLRDRAAALRHAAGKARDKYQAFWEEYFPDERQVNGKFPVPDCIEQIAAALDREAEELEKQHG